MHATHMCWNDARMWKSHTVTCFLLFFSKRTCPVSVITYADVRAEFHPAQLGSCLSYSWTSLGRLVQTFFRVTCYEWESKRKRKRANRQTLSKISGQTGRAGLALARQSHVRFCLRRHVPFCCLFTTKLSHNIFFHTSCMFELNHLSR